MELVDFPDESLAVVHEGPAHYDLRWLVFICLFGLGVSGSAHEEDDHHWPLLPHRSPAVESSGVIRLFEFLGDQFGQDFLEEVGFVLGIDIGHVLQHPVKIGLRLLLDVVGLEQIGLPACLVVVE